MRLCVKDFTTDFTDFTDGELIRAARVASVKSVNPWLPFGGGWPRWVLLRRSFLIFSTFIWLH
jgi:hypothetical protein